MDSFGGRPDAAIFEVRLLRQNVIMIVASSQRAMCSGATRGGDLDVCVREKAYSLLGTSPTGGWAMYLSSVS